MFIRRFDFLIKCFKLRQNSNMLTKYIMFEKNTNFSTDFLPVVDQPLMVLTWHNINHDCRKEDIIAAYLML